MPKGTPAADDMAVRLSWPQPPSPFAEANHDHRDRASGTPETGTADLELVLQRLDVISHQLKALMDTVESLRTAGPDASTRANGDPSGATSRSPRSTTPRRKSAT